MEEYVGLVDVTQPDTELKYALEDLLDRRNVNFIYAYKVSGTHDKLIEMNGKETGLLCVEMSVSLI